MLEKINRSEELIGIENEMEEEEEHDINEF